MRTPVWGLPTGPPPRDHRGVPEYWPAGSCIMPRDPPEQVLVVGLGRWSHGADASGPRAGLSRMRQKPSDGQKGDVLQDAIYRHRQNPIRNPVR